MVDSAAHDFSSIMRFVEVDFGLGLIGLENSVILSPTGLKRLFVRISSPKPPFGDVPFIPPDC
jgi:hypothetical protein